MRIHREEAFGPVATLYRVADIDEAIERGQRTDFGLGANAWTDDAAEQRAVHPRPGGRHGVHQRQRPPRTPSCPFGGVKTSGYGRELSDARHPRVLQHQDGLDRRAGFGGGVTHRIGATLTPGAGRPHGDRSSRRWCLGPPSRRAGVVRPPGPAGLRGIRRRHRDCSRAGPGAGLRRSGHPGGQPWPPAVGRPSRRCAGVRPAATAVSPRR